MDIRSDAESGSESRDNRFRGPNFLNSSNVMRRRPTISDSGGSRWTHRARRKSKKSLTGYSGIRCSVQTTGQSGRQLPGAVGRFWRDRRTADGPNHDWPNEQRGYFLYEFRTRRERCAPAVSAILNPDKRGGGENHPKPSARARTDPPLLSKNDPGGL